MKRLFDPTKPHFTIWVWIYNADTDSIAFRRSTSPYQPRECLLHYAALYGLRDVIEYLIIECSQALDARSGSRGQTPLSVASNKGHIEVTRLLLHYRADPNAKDNTSRAPLHAASQRGHVDVVQVLLEHRADPNIRDDYDWTPLHQASQHGHTEIAHVLLETGQT